MNPTNRSDRQSEVQNVDTHLQIVMHQSADVCRVEARGDIDYCSAGELSRALHIATAQHPQRVEIDLSAATFFSAAGSPRIRPTSARPTPVG
jgi:anti-anti-sigma regulatory factor